MLWKTSDSISCKLLFELRETKKNRNFLFLKEEGEQRTSIILGKWNPSKHIEWINTNPRRRSTTGNIKERQYELSCKIYFDDLFPTV